MSDAGKYEPPQEAAGDAAHTVEKRYRTPIEPEVCDGLDAAL